SLGEQAQAEQALRASESKYRMLMEQAADAIFIFDRQGRVTEVNPQACTMLGYRPEELLQLTLADVVAQDLRTVPIRFADLRKGKVLSIERPLRRRDGSVVLTEVSAKQLNDGRVQAIVRDIAARKQAEMALETSER